MSTDNSNNGGSSSNNSNNNSNNPQNNADMSRPRRGSVTSAAFTNLFQRSTSTSGGTAVFPGPITSAAMHDQRRRLSISTVGLSGTSPTNPIPFAGGNRRSSMSTSSSDPLDESAIEDDDGGRTGPNTPFSRRMSFGAQAMRGLRSGGGASPGSANDQGFNWSEQLRSRAESSVATGSRPSFGLGSGLSGSPPRSSFSGPTAAATGGRSSYHDRAKSVSDIPAPPVQSPKPRQSPRPKPDHFQERILKGDFYMD